MVLVTINLERKKINYTIFISLVFFFICIHSSYSNENGKILAYAAGCYECHTSNPLSPFGGGYKIKTKYGIFTSPNITKSKIFGIGAWSKKEFINEARIIHGSKFDYTQVEYISNNIDVNYTYEFEKEMHILLIFLFS